MLSTPPDATLARLLDAARSCVAQVGVGKTTLDDVARAAGVSRATLYRHLPGKQALLLALLHREVERLAATIELRIGEPETLSEAITGLLVITADELARHDAAQFVLTHESDLVLPFLIFDGADGVLAAATAIAAPHLEPFCGVDAGRAGEWVARLLLSALVSPSTSPDLRDPVAVRAMVDAFVVPGLGRPAPALGPSTDVSQPIPDRFTHS